MCMLLGCVGGCGSGVGELVMCVSRFLDKSHSSYVNTHYKHEYMC